MDAPIKEIYIDDESHCTKKTTMTINDIMGIFWASHSCFQTENLTK